MQERTDEACSGTHDAEAEEQRPIDRLPESVRPQRTADEMGYRGRGNGSLELDVQGEDRHQRAPDPGSRQRRHDATDDANRGDEHGNHHEARSISLMAAARHAVLEIPGRQSSAASGAPIAASAGCGVAVAPARRRRSARSSNRRERAEVVDAQRLLDDGSLAGTTLYSAGNRTVSSRAAWGPVHANERFAGANDILATLRGPVSGGRGAVEEAVRESAAGLVLSTQDGDETTQGMVRGETRKDERLLEMLVVVLHESPDEPGRGVEHFR
jgi:hypothetical protein